MEKSFYINAAEYFQESKAGENLAPKLSEIIKKCSENGGGIVIIPPGNYICSTVILRSNVSLYISPGAIIIGSNRIEEYISDCLVRTQKSKKNNVNGAIFYGEKVQNVKIYGEGIIDGNGETFWIKGKNTRKYIAKNRRPNSVIQLVNSENISIESIKLQNAPTYTIWLMGCNSVNISKIRIRNPEYGPNTDGIDIDCSSNVAISDCDIIAGDDCIALKSDTYRLGRNACCSNIVVNNCTLKSPTCGIRIGYEGDGVIKNCVFSNLTIYDTMYGINVLSIISLQCSFTNILHGATIKNIIFSNITMEKMEKSFYIWQGTDSDNNKNKLKGGISDLMFSNIISESSNGSFIGGLSYNQVESLIFNNIKCRFTCNASKATEIPPDVWGAKAKLPYAFTIYNAQNITFKNSNFDFGENHGWQDFNLINVDNIKGITE